MNVKDNTAITHSNGSTLLTGDAIEFYRRAQLKAFIGLYIKTGMIPTRGVTISKMLKLATEITGQTYKNNREGWLKAEADLDKNVKTLRAAIPDVDNRTK